MGRKPKNSSAALEWVLPRGSDRRYELRRGSKVIATLTRPKLFGSLAVAELPDGSWTMKRAGFLQPRVTVRRQGSDEDYAVFRPRWTGSGDIEFSDGRRYA